jgi:hypothetical protein
MHHERPGRPPPPTSAIERPAPARATRRRRAAPSLVAGALLVSGGCALLAKDDFTKGAGAGGGPPLEGAGGALGDEGGGGAGPAGGAGAAGGGGGGQGGAGGAPDACSAPVPPAGVCSQACAEGVCSEDGAQCIRRCRFGACVGAVIDCPDSLDCLVQCVDPTVCQKAQIYCPPGHACEVQCLEKGSCKDTIVDGDAGAVTVACTGEAACENMRLYCGERDCVVTGAEPGKPGFPKVESCPPEPCDCPDPTP